MTRDWGKHHPDTGRTLNNAGGKIEKTPDVLGDFVF